MITFACSCGKRIQVADESGGKKVRCPGCSGVIRVPAAEAALPVARPAATAAPAARGRRAAAAAATAEPMPTTEPCVHCRRPMLIGAPQCPHCGMVSLNILGKDKLGKSKRTFDWRGGVAKVVWLAVAAVAIWAIYTYGLVFYNWILVTGKWTEIEAALDDDPVAGDSQLWRSIGLADELGLSLEPLVIEKLDNAKNSVVEQRCFQLLAYASTRFPLSEPSIAHLERGIESLNTKARLWALRALSMAAGGEAAYVCLLPFSGSHKVVYQYDSTKAEFRSVTARRILERLEPTSEDMDFNLTLVAGRVIAGDSQALAAMTTLLEPVTNRGKVKDILFRISGRILDDPAQFTAWWEGSEGAYMKKRPAWLVEAFSIEPPERHMTIDQQLRALSGQNFNYNHAAAKSDKEKSIMSWKAWWEKEKDRWNR